MGHKNMEDREKIFDKILELNNGADKGPWDEVRDFTMLPSVKSENGQYNITMDEGVAMKIFVNTETGDTKMYWADKFMKTREKHGDK